MTMANDPHRGQPVLHRGPQPASARLTMILVHGRGAGAEDVMLLAAEFDTTDVAFLAPQAAGRTWYPYSFLSPIADNEPGITSGLGVIGGLVDSLVAQQIPHARIALLGFSQGACLSLEFAARQPRRYAAVIGLSGGLIGPPGTPRDYPGSLDQGRYFWAAATSIRTSRSGGCASRRVFRRMGASVDERIYKGMGIPSAKTKLRPFADCCRQVYKFCLWRAMVLQHERSLMSGVKQPLLGLLVACALAAGACSNSADDTTTGTGTAPTAPVTTEPTITGTVPVGGSDVHQFTVVASNGTLTVTMTAAGPPATITMGIGIGQPIGGTCQLLSGGTINAPASTTPQLSGVVNAGTYCLMIYESGTPRADQLHGGRDALLGTGSSASAAMMRMLAFENAGPAKPSFSSIVRVSPGSKMSLMNSWRSSTVSPRSFT